MEYTEPNGLAHVPGTNSRKLTRLVVDCVAKPDLLRLELQGVGVPLKTEEKGSCTSLFTKGRAVRISGSGWA